MATPSQQLNPESLVTRIIAELQANPDAQALLLRALLTNEFLGVPLRLERMEADLAEMKVRQDRMAVDLAILKGDSLEVKLTRRVRPLLGQRLGLRRLQILQSLVQDTRPELFQPVEDALDNGVITEAQEARISATDIILLARRREDPAPVWAAIEVSNNISQHDIERARQSADALGTVFQQEALAAVAGYSIHDNDQEQADGDGANVYVLLVGENN